jgi:hypothetical protein
MAETNDEPAPKKNKKGGFVCLVCRGERPDRVQQFNAKLK